MRRLLLFVVIAVCLALGVSAQQFDYSQIAPHPRLLWPAGGEAAVRISMANYPQLTSVHNRILAYADKSLELAPLERIKQGKRLLHVSNEALKRICYLAYAYRMTGEQRYAVRAEQEMRQLCGFSDWNPTHFLDVGEMVMALAFGYDWLFDQLSPDTKALVEAAVLEKGFNAAKDQKNAWFYNSPTNWNSVCNGGLTLGALAMYEAMPDEAEAIIEKCLLTNPKAMACYGPDGGYPEGYMYWGYGTAFQVMLVASLESALGSSGGLDALPGFLESARFIEYMSAPSGRSFNYSDCSTKESCMIMEFWFAYKLADPSVLAVELSRLNRPDVVFSEERLLPSLMIFSSKFDLNNVTAPASPYWFNRGATPTFVYRSGWRDSTDTYLGVKGGTPSTSHAHMDAGSFVYEKDGCRWATDLGSQNYLSLESKGVDLWNMRQNSQRWDVFRIGCTAHNTLVVNNSRHNVAAHADITKTFRSKRKKGAEVDMTSTLAKSGIKKAIRKVTLDAADNLHVVDNIATADSAAQIMWIMVTPAQARIADSGTIELTQGGHTMQLKASAPAGVEMKIWSNDPVHDYDMPNPDTRRVGFVTSIPPNSKSTLRVDLVSAN